MEMTILGSHHFLITMTQSGSKGPELRYFVVKNFLPPKDRLSPRILCEFRSKKRQLRVGKEEHEVYLKSLVDGKDVFFYSVNLLN